MSVPPSVRERSLLVMSYQCQCESPNKREGDLAYGKVRAQVGRNRPPRNSAGRGGKRKERAKKKKKDLSPPHPKREWLGREVKEE